MIIMDVINAVIEPEQELEEVVIEYRLFTTDDTTIGEPDEYVGRCKFNSAYCTLEPLDERTYSLDDYVFVFESYLNNEEDPHVAVWCNHVE